MTRTKKSLRFLTVILLAVTMLFSSAVSAFAAGVETWYSNYVVEPSFTANGYNFTPTKTMGVSGELYVDATFVINNSSSTTRCKLQIRNLSGSILASSTATTTGTVTLAVHLPVTLGQQIRVYTDTYDYSTGVARTATITYAHCIL